MPINRRGFLGSVLGLVASHPFLVKLYTEPTQQIPKLVCHPDFNIAIHDRITDTIIQAPGIKVVAFDVVKSKWLFLAHKILARQSLNIDKVFILDKDKNILRIQKPFNGSIPLQQDMRLTLTSTMSISCPIKTNNFKNAYEQWKEYCHKCGLNPITDI